MVSEEGIVQEIVDSKAIIRVQRNSACAGCHSQGACRPSESREMVVEALNEVRAKVGDRVLVSVPTGSFLKLAFLVYLVPVVTLILGAAAGNEWGPMLNMDATAASILFGASAMGLTILTVKRLDQVAQAKTQYWPRVTRILPTPNCQLADNK